MPLYTFIAEHDDGTYISQVSSTNPQAALLAWAQQLEVGTIPGLGPKTKRKLLDDLHRDAGENRACVPLDSIHHAWCTTHVVRGKLMLINFVQTEE